jgi:multidrug efflux pump subunit AcrA (membrane-fusion protein)
VGVSAVGVWRKWVFPIVKTVFVAVIAVALVKLAFFPDQPAPDPALQPTGTVAQPEVPVARGTISNELVLSGSVSADAPLAVKATASGTVDEVFAKPGQGVASGDLLYDIKVENPVTPVEQAGPDGFPIVTTPSPTFRFEQVRAPSAGVLAAIDVIPGQPVSTGDTTARVQPPGFHVTAALSPEQQYRLTSAPTEATVTIAGGPAPFTCGGLTIEAAADASGDDGAASPGALGGTGSSGGGTSVRCAVPGDVRVFQGLTAQVKIAAGSADDVLMVPVTAVEGGAESGVVWRLAPDGGEAEQPVRLGLSDGTNVEVLEGLAEGDLILQFVPGAPATPGVVGPDGCTTMPDGSVSCMMAG